jgi:hypothetical protein
MPAYRAETTLTKTVADIPAGIATEIILVDDASTDSTVRVAEELGLTVVVHPENRGYGGNQKTCYAEALEAGADIVVLLHPDYQYDPKAIPLLIAPILAGDADMTFGSRFAGLGQPMKGGMPAYRFIGNRITTVVENLALGSRFTDMHSGLRAYTRACLLSLPFLGYSEDFLFDSQLLVDAVMGGQRVVEVPIPTRYTKESSSIAIGPSTRYVVGSLAYAARQLATKGRRGRRSRVTAPERRAPADLGPDRHPVERTCPLCGGRDHALVVPATASGAPPPAAFACTDDGLGEHDGIVRCHGCGLLSAMPPLEPGDVVDRYSEVVDDDYLAEETGRRELFTWVCERIERYALPGRRLFEVGSHVGLFLDVAGSRGWRARGIEPSKWAVDVGRETFRVDLRAGDVDDLDEPAASADAVVMLDVIEHLVDPIGALLRLREVVDQAGVLVLSTIDVSSVHARARKVRWPWFIRAHLWYFTPTTLRAVLDRAGFEVVELVAVPRSFRLSYLARRVGTSMGVAGRAAAAVAKVADVRVPVGWLGDIVLVVARPRPPG